MSDMCAPMRKTVKKMTSIEFLNQMTVGDLMIFNGIGLGTATKIVNRQPMRSVKTLLDIDGIGPVRYKAVCDGLVRCLGSTRTTSMPSRTDMLDHLNDMSVRELMQIPLVGATLGSRIYSRLPLRSLEDLRQVDRLGEKTYGSICEYLSA